MKDFLTEPLLEELGVAHGFGLRGCPGPAVAVRPVQVHGTKVVVVSDAEGPGPGEADALVSDTPGLAVAIVTADCVPILLADASAGVVAAVHAGWRGLAAGVVSRGVEALLARGADPTRLRAAIGPHIGSGCYEVDEPVIAGLRARFGVLAQAALAPTRAGHAELSLAALVGEDLRGSGVLAAHIGSAAAACTRCEPRRFHSYRRDGPRAGRLLHWIVAPPRSRREPDPQG